VCGIAGIHAYREPERPIDGALLDAMTDQLAHRGPDGRGTWRAPGIGLGHRRLSILDLSDVASQPMVSADAACVLSYNGEIYNFRELRHELEAKGASFRGTGDTEVLLAGYRAWGEGVLERISGIFAFALWDVVRGTLLLARDPIGVKPLFYADDGACVRFGSEIKAILTDPAVPRDPDPAALDAFFTHSYTPAPATGFAAVRQLLPGECARVSAQGLRTRRYWEPRYAEQARDIALPQAVEEFSAQLDAITKAQMVSDVPVGGFLSGGLDSAAILRAMKRASPGRVHSLTVGFDEAGFDERAAAAETAAALGVPTDQQQVPLDVTDLLPKLALHLEEPTADSSSVPVYLLCREARKRFTVAMSGDGADEILAGYDTYRATALAAWYRRLPGPVRRGLVAPLARRIPIRDGKYALHQVATRFVGGAERGPGRDHAAWRVIFDEGLKDRLYPDDFAARVADCDALGAYAAATRAVPPGREPLLGLLHADTSFYLPNDMLVKVDRMSMAHGLEVRVPFLDVAMVDFAADLPADHKLHRGRVRKHVLRESLRGSLPDRVLDLPKSGFNIPVEQWMRGALGDMLLDLAASHEAELSPWLRREGLESIMDDHRRRRGEHGHALFSALMFTLWIANVRDAWRPT
jgi:asparagine synthase (glutamine-hydrolysing)